MTTQTGKRTAGDFFARHPVFTHAEFVSAHAAGSRRSPYTANNILAHHLAAGHLARAVARVGGGRVRLALDDLQREAAATGFPAETIEKALRLLSLLDALRSHPYLRTRVAVKGGTALNLSSPG